MVKLFPYMIRVRSLLYIVDCSQAFFTSYYCYSRRALEACTREFNKNTFDPLQLSNSSKLYFHKKNKNKREVPACAAFAVWARCCAPRRARGSWALLSMRSRTSNVARNNRLNRFDARSNPDRAYHRIHINI